MRAAPRIDVRYRNRYNPTLNYQHYMVPGILVALVTLIVLQLVVPGINRYFIAPPQILSYAAGVNLTPADRLIVATARVANATLVTRDRRILDYAGRGHLTTIAA